MVFGAPIHSRPAADRRSTPDYTQQGVKWRLFALIASIMVLWAGIERASDRSFWKWLSSLSEDQTDSLPKTRLDPPLLRTAGDPAGTFVAIDSAVSSEVSESRAQIRDDTVLFRPAERETWFHEIARVRDTDPQELRRMSVGKVGYLQLFKQPADYRGKSVTVAGTVKLAYRVAVPANDLDIKEYFVYWILPAGGPSSPIVVYALGAPPGFPPILYKDVDGTNKMHEDVEVTGIFFKRWAYAGQDGTYTAPLVLANVPTWKRSLALQPAALAPRSPAQFAAAAIGALLIAIGITAVLWKRTTSRKPAQPADIHVNPHAWAGITVGRSPQETLRALERQARDDKRAV